MTSNFTFKNESCCYDKNISFEEAKNELGYIPPL